jgi:hypothetical protein
MARDKSEIPNNMRKVYRRLQRWRSSHTGLWLTKTLALWKIKNILAALPPPFC